MIVIDGANVIPAGHARVIEDCTLTRDRIADVYPEIYAGFNERPEDPDGFIPDVPIDDTKMLRLATVRSHDQLNTAIYSLNDRYRGVWERLEREFNSLDAQREPARRRSGLTCADRPG